MYPDFLRRRMMFDILFSMGWARNSRPWQNEPNEVHHGNLQEQLKGPLSDADDQQNVIGALSGVGATKMPELSQKNTKNMFTRNFRGIILLYTNLI